MRKRLLALLLGAFVLCTMAISSFAYTNEDGYSIFRPDSGYIHREYSQDYNGNINEKIFTVGTCNRCGQPITYFFEYTSIYNQSIFVLGQYKVTANSLNQNIVALLDNSIDCSTMTEAQKNNIAQTQNGKVFIHRSISNEYINTPFVLYQYIPFDHYYFNILSALDECIDSISTTNWFINVYNTNKMQSYINSTVINNYKNSDTYQEDLNESYQKGYSDAFFSVYESGFQDGYWLGYESGISEGYEKGNADGYLNGYNDGNDFGFSFGFQIGSDEGYYNGLEQGREESFQNGYDTGYDAGYKKGEEDFSSSSYLDGYTAGTLHGQEMTDWTFAELLNGVFSGLSEFIEPFTSLGINDITIESIITLIGVVYLTLLLLRIIRG